MLVGVNRAQYLYKCVQLNLSQVEIVISARVPAPKFTQPVYTATIEENLQPPQFLIDLDTDDELSAVKVKYFLVAGDEDGMSLDFTENVHVRYNIGI